MGPWINKKIVEYIGEEEPTLREFICNKVCIKRTESLNNKDTVHVVIPSVTQLACHVSAQDILQDIAMVRGSVPSYSDMGIGNDCFGLGMNSLPTGPG